jgi:hypothetical protein
MDQIRTFATYVEHEGRIRTQLVQADSLFDAYCAAVGGIGGHPITNPHTPSRNVRGRAFIAYCEEV